MCKLGMINIYAPTVVFSSGNTFLKGFVSVWPVSDQENISVREMPLRAIVA
jgi:hypothetical protein